MLKKESVFKKIFLDNMILVIFTLVLYCSFVFVYEYETNKKSAMQESVELTNKMNRALRDYINQIDGTISSFYYEMYQNESGALATFLGSEEEGGYAKVQQVKALGKKYTWLYFFFLAGLMMPFQMRMIPLYKMIVNLKLINKLIGIILVYCGSRAPMSVFFLTGFVKTVPRELEEAAQCDGAGLYRTFFTIVFPLLRGALVTVGILCTFAIWNDYLMPMLFLQSRNKLTITVMLSNFQGMYASDWSMIFAGVCLIAAPMLVIYLIAQKAIIGGITSGAVKG